MVDALDGFSHLPNVKLIGGDVVEFWLLLLLDCFLQMSDGFTEKYLNRKDAFNVGSENRAEDSQRQRHFLPL
jgi:hypothetical protein